MSKKVSFHKDVQEPWVDVDGSVGNAKTETSSLLPGSDGDGGGSDGGDSNGAITTSSSFRSKLVWRLRYFLPRIIGVVFVFVGGVLAGRFLFNGSSDKLNKEKETTTFVSLPESTLEADIYYRSFCEVVPDGTNVRMIQTSMASPSEQWSEKPCFRAVKRNQKNDNPGEYNMFVNTYGMADAVLQVNFSQIAFPQRKPILGFGGAFTEAAAMNFERLSQKGKETVIELLFGKNGLGYTLGRIPMNSCDFSVKSYSFDDVNEDFSLTHFDTGLHHNCANGMVDMALRAASVLKESWGEPLGKTMTPIDGDKTQRGEGIDGNLLLVASPWSPPAWMKAPTPQDSDNATHASSMVSSAQPCCLKDGPGPESLYARTWALYFSKFVTAHANLGLPLWAVTVQNEPEFPAPWEACSYTPTTELEFLANHLGPQLSKDHPDLNIFIFDHNKDHMNIWAKEILNETSPAAAYVSGTAYHWYAGGNDRLLDGALGTPNMHRYQSDLKELNVSVKHLVFNSEACHCPSTGYAGGDINVYWPRAERYAHTILADLAAGSNGWIEWNLVLDAIGGPNHLGNQCDAPILAVPHRALNMVGRTDVSPLPSFEAHTAPGNVTIGDGRTREELNTLGFPAKYLDVGIAVQPLYYYMGHISRHVRPGSRAVMGIILQPSNGRKTFQRQVPANDGAADALVLGGGINKLASQGIELTAWPCEGSTRQKFDWNFDTTSKRIQVFGHDWLGTKTTSCIARSTDEYFKGMLLTACTKKHAGLFDIVPEVGREATDPSSLLVRIRLLNHPKDNEKPCLVIKKLENDGGAYGPLGGAQIALGDCSSRAALWEVNKETGEASSTYFSTSSSEGDDGRSRVCMTTGWPFLQMGAFVSSASDDDSSSLTKTVVVLNEAEDPANYVLYDGNNVLLTSSIPAHSIQTLTIG